MPKKRRTNLDAALIRRIATKTRLIGYPITAANSCGVPNRSYYRWTAKGRQDIEDGRETIYSRLVDAVNQARSEAVEDRVRVVKEAAEGNTPIVKNRRAPVWTAAAWWLERTHPELFGLRREENNADGPTTIVFNIETTKSAVEVSDAIEKARAKAESQ